MKEKIGIAVETAWESVKAVSLPEEYKQRAFGEVLAKLLDVEFGGLGARVAPASSTSSVGQSPQTEYNSFNEYILGIEGSNAELIAAMADYHARKNPADPRITMNELGEFFKLIPQKSANLSRDAKTAVMQAWLKRSENKEGQAAWEIIPLGRKHVETLRKNEE